MCDEASCFRAELIEDTVVSIGDNLLRVKVNGADLGNFCTDDTAWAKLFTP